MEKLDGQLAKTLASYVQPTSTWATSVPRTPQEWVEAVKAMRQVSITHARRASAVGVQEPAATKELIEQVVQGSVLEVVLCRPTHAKALRGEFKKLRGCKGKYVELWLSRCLLIARMRAAGLPGLSLNGVGVRIVSRMAPDQNRWIWCLTHVDRRVRIPVRSALRALAYTGPVEMFSCWACLCGGIASEQVIGREIELRQACIEFEVAHGWRPHPAVLVQS